MVVKIASAARAQEVLTKEDVAVCISIVDPQTNHPAALKDAEDKGTKVLRLLFDDVERWRADDAVPNRRHVEMLLEFGRNEGFDEIGPKPQIFLIHCAAGMSRSPAVALALYTQRMLGNGAPFQYTDSAKRLFAERAYAAMLNACLNFPEDISPNRLLVQLTDEVLSMDGHLVRTNNRLKGW